VAFFRRKLGNLVPTEFWDDMLREEHDRGFMVAGAAKADLLTDLAAAVDKAIAEGRGIEEFRRDFDAIVRRHGWTGWTGQGTVQGEAWRVKTILRTNSYTSYAAGRLAQLRASNFKWWIYRHGGSQEPRPQHLSWDGLMLPPDHSFWDKFYPPSDWGCSCYVVGANSNAAARRMGGKPDKKLPDGWDSIDPKTGAPEGIGRGWDYAPGASVSGEVSAIAGKVRLWDQQVSKAFMAALPPGRADELADAYRRLPSTADDLRRYAQRVEEGSAAGDENRRPLPPVRTLGLVRTDQAARLASLKDGLDVSGFDYVIDTELSTHIFNRHGKRSNDPFPIEPSDFALLPAIASNPDVIELGKASKLGNLQRVIMRKAIGGVLYEAIWEVRSGRRSLYLKSFFVKRPNRG
jgi:hypothetical protein